VLQRGAPCPGVLLQACACVDVRVLCVQGRKGEEGRARFVDGRPPSSPPFFVRVAYLKKRGTDSQGKLGHLGSTAIACPSPGEQGGAGGMDGWTRLESADCNPQKGTDSSHPSFPPPLHPSIHHPCSPPSCVHDGARLTAAG